MQHTANDKEDVKLLIKQHLSGPSPGELLLIVDNTGDVGVMFGGVITDRHS